MRCTPPELPSDACTHSVPEMTQMLLDCDGWVQLTVVDFRGFNQSKAADVVKNVDKALKNKGRSIVLDLEDAGLGDKGFKSVMAVTILFSTLNLLSHRDSLSLCSGLLFLNVSGLLSLSTPSLPFLTAC